jgi:DNA invertase Pin-like site-specific DNA recombinase
MKPPKGRPKAVMSLAEKTRRESAVIRLRQGGVPAEVIAAAFGITDRTLRRWNAEFSAEN